jgi:hypothetical protein
MNGTGTDWVGEDRFCKTDKIWIESRLSLRISFVHLCRG